MRYWPQKPPLGVPVNWGDPLANGLVGCWLMNETGAGQIRSLPSSDDVLSVSGPVWTAGRFGSCLNFDGLNDNCTKSVANWRSNDSQGTISIWIRWEGENSASTSQDIFSSADIGTDTYFVRLLLYRIDASTFYLALLERSAAVINWVRGGTNWLGDTSKWHHIVGLSTGLQYQIYIDGKPEALTVVSGSNNGAWYSSVANRDHVTIGDLNETAIHRYFKGNVSHAMYWNRALSASEVQQLYMTPFRMFQEGF